MATKKKAAILDPGVEEVVPTEVETPTPAVQEEVPEVSVPAPKAAKPVEQVGNADVSDFTPLSDEEYKKLNDQQREDYIARRSKHELITGPQVMFMVPLSSGEKPGSTETVSLNGYRLNIRKGAMVRIPAPMAQIIAEKYQIEMEAGSHMLLDRDERTAEALA